MECQKETKTRVDSMLSFNEQRWVVGHMKSEIH